MTYFRLQMRGRINFYRRPQVAHPWCRPVFCQSGRNLSLGGDFDRQGAKHHKGIENAQPIIDHWVNSRILLLWLVSFLQILTYHDNSLEVVAKAIYLLNFYSGSSMCPAAVWIISGLRSSFHEHGSISGALSFQECHSGFCSFSHIYILIVLVCLKLNGKWIKSSTQN